MTTGNLQISPSALTPGDFTAVLKDNNGNPSTVMEADKDFTVETDWHIDQALANLLAGGDWEVTLYFDEQGSPTNEGAITNSSTPTKVTQVAGTKDYTAKITVPANTFPNNVASPSSGTYELVVVLTFTTAAGTTDIAAVERLGLVRIA